MTLYFDTSALIKKYILEAGSDKVDDLMNNADSIIVSSITEVETYSTFKRLLVEKVISESDYKVLLNEFDIDYPCFTQISFDAPVSTNAKLLIEKYQLKSLDSIQLGTALLLKDDIDYFVVCDTKLISSGKKEGLKIKNPLA
ncbi:MAG TPA: type II toxin-antitoxin system VapC family toxin [Spirochaetota bacterium]|nr:type II toxin-antitoxin system VapC family toxin [Spirochaetota bacterium]